MKTIFILLILFCTIAMPAFAELTPQDLDKIRLIVNEEIKKESATINEKIDKTHEKIDRLGTRIQDVEKDMSWVRGKLEGVEKQVSHVTNVTYGLIALIVVAIGIPAWRGRRDLDQERKIEELTAEIETLKQIVNP